MQLVCHACLTSYQKGWSREGEDIQKSSPVTVGITIMHSLKTLRVSQSCQRHARNLINFPKSSRLLAFRFYSVPAVKPAPKVQFHQQSI